MKSLILAMLITCLFAAAGRNVSGQQVSSSSPPQASEIEAIRRLLDEQKAEIELLRSELRKETELRSQQQALLESMMQRFESLVASLPKAAAADQPATVDMASQNKNPAAQPNNLAVTTSVVKTAAPQATPPGVVESGFGRIKFTGLLQGGLVSGDEGVNDTFRVRRAELRFTGDILPKLKWSVMFDLAKALSVNTTTSTINGTPVIGSVSVNQPSRIFQEGFITYAHSKKANFQIGQFKIPLSQEGLQSTATLDTVERALFLTDRSRGGGLGDARDIGAMLFGALHKQVDYQIGIFNGVDESQNGPDQNDQKAVVGRIVFRPSFIEGLQIGGSGAYGTAPRSPNPRRDRLGGELVYQRGKVRVKSELMTGINGDTHSRGYYAHFGYRIQPKLELIFRYDTFDPNIRLDTTGANVNERDYLSGVNYFFKNNNLKLQLNYVRRTFANGVVPSKNLFLANLQTSW